jgi:phage shock protein A
MTLMTRFQTIVRAELTSMVSRFENPEKILGQLILDMEEALADARRATIRAMADEHRLRSRCEHHEAEAATWRRHAEEAVARRDEAAAREALRRADGEDRRASRLREQHAKQEADTRRLREAIRDLAEKIDEARQRKNLLVARLRRASAQTEIHATMRGLSESSAFDMFERMDDRVCAAEAEAEAYLELEDDLDPSRAARRDAENAERDQRVEDRLRDLKKDAAKP